MKYKTRLASLIIWILSLVLWTAVEARDSGFDELRLDAAGVEIKVFTYRPPSCANPSILFVFHGLKRNAKSGRKKAVKIARDACLMVFAPLFDKDRFPNWRYHRGGVVYKGQVLPESRWTGPVLLALLERARQVVGNQSAKLYLFGHSAGGQFLSRIAAYTPPLDVDRIVISNPSVYVAPLLDEKAPYGFKGVFSSDKKQQQLKTYLGLPVTLYLGKEDTGKKYLKTNKASMRQGHNRLDRGRKIFNLAKEVAKQNDWPFNWQLVEVPEVGHSSRGMLEAKEFYRALGFK